MTASAAISNAANSSLSFVPIHSASTGDAVDWAPASDLALIDLASWASTSPPLAIRAGRRTGVDVDSTAVSTELGNGYSTKLTSGLMVDGWAVGKGIRSGASWFVFARLGPSGVGFEGRPPGVNDGA